MRTMCHDCPHRREHEVGDCLVIVGGNTPGYNDTRHPCHNAMHLPCVGSEMQFQKFRSNVCQVEDFEEVRTINVG